MASPSNSSSGSASRPSLPAIATRPPGTTTPGISQQDMQKHEQDCAQAGVPPQHELSTVTMELVQRVPRYEIKIAHRKNAQGTSDLRTLRRSSCRYVQSHYNPYLVKAVRHCERHRGVQLRWWDRWPCLPTSARASVKPDSLRAYRTATQTRHS